MTDEDLRRLAEAATPGPWAAMRRVEPAAFHNGTWNVRAGEKEPDGWICTTAHEPGGNDAAFIAAAHPQAVLSLLDRLAAAEAALATARREAVEEAARVARRVTVPEDCSAVEAHGRMMAALEAAAAIRALAGEARTDG